MRHVASVVHQIQHVNLVEVDYFEPHDHIYTMVMRLIDGFDLRRLLQQDSLTRLRHIVTPERWEKLNQVIYKAPRRDADEPEKWGLQPGMAVNIIEKCLRGISALHDKDIVHGDIKPSNIMLGIDGGIRLIDINSAFELSSLPKVSAWTPRYAPPEVLTERAWSPQSDLASLGYVLIELLSGHPEALGENASSKSTRSTDDQSYPKLLEAKMLLPERLAEILPRDACKSQCLMELCQSLIHPDPSLRVQSTRNALSGESGAIPFKHELVHAHLAVDWVEEIKCWLRDMKQAMCDNGTRISGPEV
jgi:serine/threonine-protein kinase